ncbi:MULTISPECIES: DUF5522 domain-containing protein [Methylobacter]|uniref:DUF5522 domain-containing protein n=1 Tax=Methylobacter TaxID=429 RepID=UPI001FAD7C0A|nr:MULTISPECIES: DUF5522 domain-containing protein [Methylobacter]UOA10391.1 hypothetical protein KKZ03_09250 [Methylobacter sp. S3L5C]
MKIEVSPQNKLCSTCGTILICGVTQTGKSCWCAAYPAIMAVDSQQDCLCENCLSKAIQGKIIEFINRLSLQDAIAAAHKYRGDGNLIQGIDYLNENNKMVFTKWYHLKRGSCCENACKNCPY